MTVNLLHVLSYYLPVFVKEKHLKKKGKKSNITQNFFITSTLKIPIADKLAEINCHNSVFLKFCWKFFCFCFYLDLEVSIFFCDVVFAQTWRIFVFTENYLSIYLRSINQVNVVLLASFSSSI